MRQNSHTSPSAVLEENRILQMKLNDRYIFAGLAIRKEKKSRSKSKREIAVDDKDFENESIEGSGGRGGFENQGQIIREMQFSPRRIFFFFFLGLLGGRARPRMCPSATRICLALKYFHRSNFPQECDT